MRGRGSKVVVTIAEECNPSESILFHSFLPKSNIFYQSNAVLHDTDCSLDCV